MPKNEACWYVGIWNIHTDGQNWSCDKSIEYIFVAEKHISIMTIKHYILNLFGAEQTKLFRVVLLDNGILVQSGPQTMEQFPL